MSILAAKAIPAEKMAILSHAKDSPVPIMRQGGAPSLMHRMTDYPATASFFPRRSFGILSDRSVRFVYLHK